MPLNTPLQTSLVYDANVALALAFFPRWRKGFWQEIAGETLSTAMVQPFSLAGAAPLMKQFMGDVTSRPIASWSLQVPNILFKNFEEIARQDIEMDQTGTILKRVNQIGIRVAQLPDFLMAQKILTADNVSSATTLYNNASYYQTFENGVPFFSTAHTSYSRSTQSNIIQGNLPTSVAGYDVATLANKMQSDIQTLVDTVAGVVDDKGVQIYPDLDPEQHFTVVVPPILKQAARLAFSTLGATIGGSNTSSTGSSGGTTSIGPTMVRRVISSPLLKGCIDVTSQNDYDTVTPQFANQYYVFIENDLVRPIYLQRFRPKNLGEYTPLGSNPEAAAAAAIKAAEQFTGQQFSQEAKDVYTSTIIDQNLSALGAQAQESVVRKEAFFMSGRTWLNYVWGPWFTGYKIDPSGTST